MKIYKIILVSILVLSLNSCFNTDVSHYPQYNSWIGKRYKLKKDAYIWRFRDKSLGYFIATNYPKPYIDGLARKRDIPIIVSSKNIGKKFKEYTVKDCVYRGDIFEIIKIVQDPQYEEFAMVSFINKKDHIPYLVDATFIRNLSNEDFIHEAMAEPIN